MLGRRYRWCTEGCGKTVDWTHKRYGEHLLKVLSCTKCRTTWRTVPHYKRDAE